MPVFGKRETGPLLEGVPLMRGLDAEPWELANVDILQLTFEIDDGQTEDLIPKALHPTIPPIIYFSVHRFPDSPAGPFLLAQARIGCRAGVRPRGYLTMAYVDSAPAADALASGWGFACRQGEISLRRYHDRIDLSVETGGRVQLEAALVRPEPISGGDVQYVANMNLARLEGPAGEEPVLVQVDPEFTFHRADRGKPVVSQFSAEGWNAGGVRLAYPVSASFAVVDTGFPRIRYVVNPERPALAGTQKVNASAKN
jgi:hypothetical protein